MKCFYHNDVDGKCSGFLVSHYTENNNPNDFIEMDYNKPFPMEIIQPEERIYIVDYSIKPEEMDKLLEITKDVIWIDHHKTAIEKYENYSHKIDGVRIDGIAGCMLTWFYFNKHLIPYPLHGHENLDMIVKGPLFIRLIADWDIWKFEYGNNTRYFQMALNSYIKHPCDSMWNNFDLNNDVLYPNSFENKLILDGSTMIQFRNSWAKSYCKSRGFEIKFENYNCFALNLSNCNKDYFRGFDISKYDILISFSYNGKLWSYSLYSDNVDVSEIAKKYGGGGHKGASGFSIKEFLF